MCLSLNCNVIFTLLLNCNIVFTCVGWLAPVDGDTTKAKCLYCEVELRAHFKDLERHTKTKKHMQRTDLWAAKTLDASMCVCNTVYNFTLLTSKAGHFKHFPGKNSIGD